MVEQMGKLMVAHLEIEKAALKVSKRADQ